MILMTSDRLASMIDPDIITALKQLSAGGTPKQQAGYDRMTQQHIETALQLLSDEVERIIPRSSPLFESVLLLSAINKVVKLQQEPEFTSYLDEGLPHQDW
jgi:hypothetical protein